MISERDIPYARPGGLELLARIDRREDASTAPAVISIHGGAWCRNERTTAVLLDRALAESGLTVLALDFRQGPAFHFLAASQDICTAARLVRATAGALQVNVDRLGLIGSSSGGQLALLSGLTHAAPHHRSTSVLDAAGAPLAGTLPDARLSFVVALWPVSDPFRRYHYAKDAGMDALVEAHHSYYDDEDQMRAASIQRILDSGEIDALPSARVAQPGNDSNVPQAMTLDLLRAYQERGGCIRHAFTCETHATAKRCIDDALAFISNEIEAA